MDIVPADQSSNPKKSRSCTTTHEQQQLVDYDQVDDHQPTATANIAPSSSWISGTTSNNLILPNNNRLVDQESDEDLFTVPDVEARPGKALADHHVSTNTTFTTTTSDSKNNKNNDNLISPDQAHSAGKRHRGRNPVDKEYERLKRLLRNRVSAQQARERKKVYVNDLESRAQELQEINSELEEKISTLLNENSMLRKVLMNTRPKADESIERKQGKS